MIVSSAEHEQTVLVTLVVGVVDSGYPFFNRFRMVDFRISWFDKLNKTLFIMVYNQANKN
jgi:hypothetical protein